MHSEALNKNYVHLFSRRNKLFLPPDLKRRFKLIMEQAAETQ